MSAKSPLEYYRERQTAQDKRRLVKMMDSSATYDVSTRMIQSLSGEVFRSSLFPALICLGALIFVFQFFLPTLGNTAADDFGGQVRELLYASAALFLAAVPLFAIGTGMITATTSFLAYRYLLGEPTEPAAKHLTTKMVTNSILVNGWIGVKAFFLPVGAWIVTYISASYGQSIGNTTATDLLSVYAVIMGGIGLIVSMYVIGRSTLAPVVAVVEGKSMFEAEKRSKYLIKSHGRIASANSQIVGVFFTLSMVLLFVGIGIYMAYQLLGVLSWADVLSRRGPFEAMLSGFVFSLPIFGILMLVIPLWTAIMTAIYVDRRVRIEAFDIRILAEDVLLVDRSKTALF